ncbi:MAG TPA: FMN-binding negative transcriptional regulator [Ilumatobacteraceae bacterium]|nr:FMN-binding negative transcriptional regulator [Ilumatobacteraceae bacterium]
MYVPAFSAIDDDEARAIVADIGSGWLVTASADGPPTATLMPVLWRDDRVVAHMARANPHWREIADGTPGLLIVGGPEAYISPSWYASKAEHGRVVPTWNYLAVHLSGSVTIRPESEWVRALVTDLTEHHERDRVDRWHVTDAPDEFIDAQLKAIVGVEMLVERVEGKAKLSQNRTDADRRGVVAGLGAEDGGRDAAVIAVAMAAAIDARTD